MNENVNITKHALMRYASRVHKHQIINDRTFDVWKKMNEDKIEDLERNLKKEYQQSEYISTASYETHKKVDFYINKETMMTFLINENNMITCYPIDFGLDSEGNRSILNILLDNLKRAKTAEENFEENYFKIKESLSQELEVILAEMELLNAKLKTLKEKKAVIEAKQAEIISEQLELKNIIKVAEEKIVRSKLAF